MRWAKEGTKPITHEKTDAPYYVNKVSSGWHEEIQNLKSLGNLGDHLKKDSFQTNSIVDATRPILVRDFMAFVEGILPNSLARAKGILWLCEERGKLGSQLCGVGAAHRAAYARTAPRFTCLDARQDAGHIPARMPGESSQRVNWSSYFPTSRAMKALDADTIRRSLFPPIDEKATPPVHDPESLREHFHAFITDPKLTVYTRNTGDGKVGGTLYVRLNAGVFMYETDVQVYEQTRIRMNDVVRTFVNLLNSSLEAPKIFVVSKTVRHRKRGTTSRLARVTLVMGIRRTWT